MKKYEPFIGLEIHIEPNTETKMFCGCPQDHFGKPVNSQTCPICLGLPGALPYENYEAIKKTVLLGLALNCKINKFSNFYRKHYFYPDLPKSFQTSQKDHPLCIGGSLLNKEIDHIHLEEDAGKLVHEVIDGEKVTLIDFNRSGCALIELVTKPVFHSTDEVSTFVKELQIIARYLDVSRADMEKGTMRLEANISLAEIKSEEKRINLPDYKVELKNINSFKFLISAIEAEIKRQTEVLDRGETLVQETRGFDEVRKVTYSQRSKEESQDYKYFPEADLAPIMITDKNVSELKNSLPSLPSEVRKEFMNSYKLPANYVDILTESKTKSDYYRDVFKIALQNKIEPKLIANLVINKGLMGENAKDLLSKIKVLSSVQYSTEEEVKKAIEEVLTENENAVQEFKSGKDQVVGFLIGMVQKKLQGKGNPSQISGSIIKKLKN